MAYCDYENSLSGEMVGDIPLKKLDTVQNPILCETVKHVRTKKLAGYQENILNYMLEDMK